MSEPDHLRGEGGRLSGRSAEEPRPIVIVLNDSQVQKVLRRVGGEDVMRDWLLGTLDRQRLHGQAPADSGAMPVGAPWLSQSLLRGLAILRALQPAGRERGVHELARELGLSPSTAHRYVATLREGGLVEQNPETRAYRLVGDEQA